MDRDKGVTYPAMDMQGNHIGSLTLFDDQIPKLMMEDEDVEFLLGGSWTTVPEVKFLNFYIVPKPAIKAEKEEPVVKRVVLRSRKRKDK